MTYGWAILAIFLAGYAAFAGAVLWHVNIYSFSRSAKVVSVIFVASALILAVFSIIFFSQIEWSGFGRILEATPLTY